jgi:hypothetical protein
MKRILRLSTLACALVATAWLASLAPVAQREANAGPYGPYYYGGGYAPRFGGYSGYSGYGYSPYGYGGYSYGPATGYVYPSVGDYSHGYGPQYPSQTYNGLFGVRYGNSGYYGQAYRPAYNPYGFGGYGLYGY